MSKSLGNTADVLSAVERYGGRAVRLYLAGPHYRSAIELSEASLAEAAAQLARIDSFLERAGRLEEPELVSARLALAGAALPDAFAAAMNDDLGTSGAMAVLFNTLKAGNVALDAGDLPAAAIALVQVRAMLGVLGLDPTAPEWTHELPSGGDLTPVVDGLVAALLEQRQQARARKDWPAADAIRDNLSSIGLKVEDTPNGPRWSIEK
jgi:cysteinyl-tRNA synthetase